MLLGSLICFC